MVKAIGEADISAADLFQFVGAEDGDMKIEPMNIAWEVLNSSYSAANRPRGTRNPTVRCLGVDDTTKVIWNAINCPFPIQSRDFVAVKHMCHNKGASMVDIIRVGKCLIFCI
jgi:hypothetical protein